MSGWWTSPGAVLRRGAIAAGLALVLVFIHAPAVQSQQARPVSQPVERLPPPSLTLADLEQRALVANPSVARAAAQVEAARGRWVQAGLPPNPEVGYEGQQLGSRGLAEQEGVVIAQEIVRGGKLHLDRAVAAQEIARAEQQLAAQQQRVRTDVRLAWYQVVAAQQQRALAQQLVEIGRQAQKASEALFKAKEVSRTDVLQAELEVENALILAQNARQRHTAAWRMLATVAGDPDLPLAEVEGTLETDGQTLVWSDVLQRMLTLSPEVSSAVMEVQRARWALERARVEATPNLSVEGLINWRDEGADGRSNGSVRVTVPFPAWNRNQGGILQAQAEVIAAEHAVAQLELNLQHRLAPVFERYANAQHQAERYRKRILPAAEETLQLTRQGYEAGEVGFVNLLTAQRTYSQTHLTYLDALRELRLAETEIEGLLLRDSLESR